MQEEKPLSEYLEDARAALSIGNYVGCIDQSNLVLQRDKNNKEALILKGASLYLIRQYGEAEKSLRRATEIDPFEPYAFYYLALTIDDIREQHPEREADLEKAYLDFMALTPDSVNDAQLRNAKMVAKNNLGSLYHKLRRNEEALPLIEDVLKSTLGNSNVRLNHIAILLEMGRYDRAEEAILEALDAKTEFYDAEHAQIELYRRTGREPLAFKMARDFLPRAEAAGRDDLADRLKNKFPGLVAINTGGASPQFAFSA